MGPGGLRGAIAGEAARLMYEEGVKQYFTCLLYTSDAADE